MNESSTSLATLMALSVICSRADGRRDSQCQRDVLVDTMFCSTSFALATTIGMATTLKMPSQQLSKTNAQESAEDDMPSLAADCRKRNQPTIVADDSSTSSSDEIDDDESWCIGDQGEGFCLSNSICDSDISVTDDEDDYSDDEFCCIEDEVVVKKPNPLQLLFQDFKAQVDDAPVPAMRPCDSDYTLSTSGPSSSDMLGKSLMFSAKKTTNNNSSQRNATWSIFG